MPNLRLDICYDGSDFHGFQIQNDKRTVQGELLRAIKKVQGESVHLFYSGRTDSGVHAINQVVNYNIENLKIPLENLKKVLNGVLAKDVRIKRVCVAEDDFHSRYSAKLRIYRYFIKSFELLPHERRYVEFIPQLDIYRLNEVAKYFVQECDFASFASKGDVINTIRRVESAYFFKSGEHIVFNVSANGFLWNMVRIILSYIIYFSKKEFFKQELEEVFARKKLLCPPKIVSARGLYLFDVEY